MVSPRAPIGKRYWPSGESREVGGDGEEYVDPFVKYDVRGEESSGGWVSWVRDGVMQSYRGAGFIASSSRNALSTGQQQVADDGEIKERLVHNALEACQTTANQRESRTVGVGLSREKRLERPLEEISAPVGGPGFLIRGQGFIPLGDLSHATQPVPLPHPPIPHSTSPPFFEGQGTTSSFHYTGSTAPARRTVPSLSDGIYSDAECSSRRKHDGSFVPETRDPWGSKE